MTSSRPTQGNCGGGATLSVQEASVQEQERLADSKFVSDKRLETPSRDQLPSDGSRTYTQSISVTPVGLCDASETVS